MNPKPTHRRVIPSPRPSQTWDQQPRRSEPPPIPFAAKPSPKPYRAPINVSRPTPPYSPYSWKPNPTSNVTPAPKPLQFTQYGTIRPSTLQAVTRSSFFIGPRPSFAPLTTTTTTTTTTTRRPQTVHYRNAPTRSSQVSTVARKPKQSSSRNKIKQTDPHAAERCTPNKCTLPYCNCASSAIPGGRKTEEIPQLVMITFDDSINDLNWDLYREIFSNRVNPNGCPALGTFYVSHEWTDYSQVQTLYSEGHEMASHSIT